MHSKVPPVCSGLPVLSSIVTANGKGLDICELQITRWAVPNLPGCFLRWEPMGLVDRSTPYCPRNVGIRDLGLDTRQMRHGHYCFRRGREPTGTN